MGVYEQGSPLMLVTNPARAQLLEVISSHGHSQHNRFLWLCRSVYRGG